MTIQEFSTEFDVLYNNVTSNQAPGLNEYEKSVFLTKSEKQLVREHFNPRIDAASGGFDGSQQRQYDFSCLLRTESLYNINTYADRIDETEKLDRRSLVFLFPENYFLAVNEILSDDRQQYSVLPIDYSEYQRLMLKPYNLPVKRGAWRLITDKKNCNFWREYVPTDDEYGEEINSDVDYVFLSTWADQKRNLRVTIDFTKDTGLPVSTEQHYPSKDGDGFYFLYDSMRCWMYGETEWINNNMTYSISMHLYAIDNLDDEEVIEALKEGFATYADIVPEFKESSATLSKICRHTDGFAQCSAPSKFTRFRDGGYTFETECIQLPMAEIIGKFRGEVKYQMRYVRTLKPIILEELSNYGDDLSIDGYTEAMECELPKEMHEEILERAVTLAKIAWAGGTATQAAQQRNSN